MCTDVLSVGGCRSPWNWTYRQLLATLWMLGTEPRPSGGATSAPYPDPKDPLPSPSLPPFLSLSVSLPLPSTFSLTHTNTLESLTGTSLFPGRYVLREAKCAFLLVLSSVRAGGASAGLGVWGCSALTEASLELRSMRSVI